MIRGLWSLNFGLPRCKTSWLFNSRKLSHNVSIMTVLIGRCRRHIGCCNVGWARDAGHAGWACEQLRVVDAVSSRYTTKRDCRFDDCTAHPYSWVVGCPAYLGSWYQHAGLVDCLRRCAEEWNEGEDARDGEKRSVKVVKNERLLLKTIRELCQENIYWTSTVILFLHLKGIKFCYTVGKLQ